MLLVFAAFNERRKWCKPPYVIVGADIRIVGGTGTVHRVEESFEEFARLSKKIDEYMDVQGYMQDMRRVPSGTTIGDGNASSKKKQRTAARDANIVLSSEDEGSSRGSFVGREEEIALKFLVMLFMFP